MIDSEGPNKCADRKAALRRQQQMLREDIENLEARAALQVRGRTAQDEWSASLPFSSSLLCEIIQSFLCVEWLPVECLPPPRC